MGVGRGEEEKTVGWGLGRQWWKGVMLEHQKDNSQFRVIEGPWPNQPPSRPQYLHLYRGVDVTRAGRF